MLLTDIEYVASDPFYLPKYKNQTLSPISVEIDNHTKFYDWLLIDFRYMLID